MIDLPFPKLLNELRWYAKKAHAIAVYGECMRRGRLKTAMKIALRYSIQDARHGHDDTVLALGLALSSQLNGNRYIIGADIAKEEPC